MENHDQFEYTNENSIHEDLLCSLCTDPFDEPLSANKCGHTFCRNCITETFKKMNQCPTCRQTLQLDDFHPVNIRPFLNQLNQLMVKCKLCLTTNIQRGNFKDHIKQCNNVHVSCPAADMKCDWKGKRDQLEEHVRTCVLMKLQPTISELTGLVKQQSEQINFLFQVLNKLSNSHKKACQEFYRTRGTAFCDICKKQFSFNEHRNRLHFCPDTDICSECVKKHFS